MNAPATLDSRWAFRRTGAVYRVDSVGPGDRAYVRLEGLGEYHPPELVYLVEGRMCGDDWEPARVPT